MLLADLSTFAESLIGEYVYLGPLVLLLLCGLGLPLPEEVSLIGAGVLLWEGEARFELMALVCVLGVIGGDAVPYTIGRLWGVNALRYRFVRRSIHPRRFRRIERRFQAHRNWAVFSCRFFPGLRWPGYFVAGTLRMAPARWLLLDLAGAVIQVPLALWLGREFGENVERLQREMDQLHLWLAGGLVLGLGLALGWRRLRRRAPARRRARARAAGARESSGARPAARENDPEAPAERAPTERAPTERAPTERAPTSRAAADEHRRRAASSGRRSPANAGRS